MFRRSMRARITVAFAAVTAAVMAAFVLSVLWYARRDSAARARLILDDAGRRVIAELTDDENPVPIYDLALEEHEQPDPDGVAVAVIAPDGAVVGRSRAGMPVPGEPGAPAWRFHTVRYQHFQVVVGVPWEAEERALRAQVMPLALLGLAVTAAAGVAGWWLVGRTLSPIGELSRQARTAETGDLRLRLQPRSDDAEITELVTTLNALLASVQETTQAANRFHAMASHELRTPLQALLGNIELALSRERSPDEYRAFLAEAASQARRLASLARDLLLLHELGSAPQAPRTDVRLRDVVERAESLAEVGAEGKGGRLRPARLPDLVIRAVPSHVEMLARNLVDNAVNHSAPGSAVDVTLREDHGTATLAVTNAASEADAAAVVARVEAASAAGVEQAQRGRGLGLVICGAVARAAGWQLSASQGEETVTVAVAFGPTSEPHGAAGANESGLRPAGTEAA